MQQLAAVMAFTACSGADGVALLIYYRENLSAVILFHYFMAVCYRKDSDKRARLAKLALIFHSECSLCSRFTSKIKTKKEERQRQWREIVGTAKFKRDFLKVVDFVHYLRAEGYDMETFDKVGNGIK